MLIGPVRTRLVVGTVLAFTGSAAGLLPYVAVVELARHLLGGAAVAETVLLWVLVGVGGSTARLALIVAANFVTHYADADLQRHLRARLARHLATVPLGWFVGRGSGELKKVMDDDIEDMHHLVAHAMPDVAGALGLPVVAIVYLVAQDWRMTLVTIAVLPAAVIAISIAHRTLPARMATLIGAQQRINAATIEHVDGIEVVKAHGSGAEASRRFSDAVDEFGDTLAAWMRESGRALFVSASLLSPALVLVVVLGAGSAFVATGSMAPVDVLPFLLVGVGITAPYMPLVHGAQLLRKAKVAASHIGDVLAEPALPEPRTPRSPATHEVRFEDVSFSYDATTTVLDRVDAVCREGEVVAVVGVSGSGKTTLTRLLARFYDVSGGAVRIGGVDVRDMAAAELSRTVATVFQDVVLVRDTVRENIRLGRPDATDAEVEAAARAANAHDVIAALPHGYDTVLGGRGGLLSGGERQRITIARVILQDAPIVVLDEATAHVDPESEVAVQEALAQLVRGRTVLVVAHRLHTIMNADQILVLEGGRIVEQGTHEDLIANGGRYQRMWDVQQALPAGATR